ncbi:MAG: RagB/SusD family nutrient uptake outer membrane protein [Bacteroidales bacterium]|nr:RagB/SusD family nutrient uptake outer membrane protein [Bacteroidales bacterium]
MLRRLELFLLLTGCFAFWGCNMDFFRSDTMTSSQFKDDPESAVYSTDGAYSMFKDILAYRGKTDSGLTFIKLWDHMSEMRGDNAMLSGRTSSPIYSAACYDDTPELKFNYYLWWCCYKIIYAANSNIEALELASAEDRGPKGDHLLGENYFIRAFAHLALSCIYSKQYALGRDNPGVVLRTSTDCSKTERSTVGEVYDQIVKDLIKAAELMKNGTRRGDAGYASYDAARGLLTRVYLYMDENQKCLDLCNEMLGTDPAANLDADLAGYPAHTRTSKETLWCIASTLVDARGRSSMGSMYYSPNGTGGVGWGEVYWTDPLIEMFLRYPEDKRFQAYFSLYGEQLLKDTYGDWVAGRKMVHWPVDDAKEPFRSNALAMGVKTETPLSTPEKRDSIYLGYIPDADGSVSFTYQGTNYKAVKKSKPGVNNGYPQYFITYKGEETLVYVRNLTDNTAGIRNTYPQYYNSKYSGQDGDPMLCSPAMIRWAEIVLNRAEAEAKLDKTADAIKDVNVIRHRAGIHEWTNFAECQTHEYTNVLDVVLDERRMEFCFEAQRPYDLIRNKKDIDHRFAGVQPWKVYNYDCNEVVFAIPADEILVSGIPQNAGKGY